MKLEKRLPLTALLFASLTIAAGGVLAADWPAYRHDLARSGVTQESVETPLYRQWIYQAAHAPQPAWPEPGRELNRLAFDYAYHPVVAGNQVYFGSSTDHQVHAIDLNTGTPRWSFFTEGPVRFAPAVAQDRVFVASDDGYLYCLSSVDGTLRWRFRGGPRDERMLGNQQMMSRWPLRTGVAIQDEIVYFSAGMWPSEGIYFYALGAANGKVIWQNDTSGSDYIEQPHPPSCSIAGVAPQGYLLGNEAQLFLPTGRNVPAAFDRIDGKSSYYDSRPNTWGDRWGGSWSMLADGLLFNWRCHVGPDIDILTGEYSPDPQDGIVAFDAQTGNVKRDFPGKLQAVVANDVLYMSGSGKITAYDFAAWRRGASAADCTKWETAHDHAYELILAGDTLVVGGAGSVTAIAADTGKVLWTDNGLAQVRGLAVAGGKLLVSTKRGEIVCYGSTPTDQPRNITFQPNNVPQAGSENKLLSSSLASRILAETGQKVGYCLVLGAGDGQLLQDLATQSELKIFCVEPDAGKVVTVRRLLDDAQLYGNDLAIHHGTVDTIHYAEHFADLIIAGSATADALKELSVREVYRLLHPYGGRLYVVAEPAGGSQGGNGLNSFRPWLVAGDVPNDEIVEASNGLVVTRGALPGAANWTHQYANAARTGSSTDQRARLPLKLLWFGEPGPEKLISRHWKGPSPLCVNGRMFVIGQYTVFAVDAYNGRQLWRRDFSKAGRFPVTTTGSNVAADEDSIYLVSDNTCLRIDAATGDTVHTYDFPVIPAVLQEAIGSEPTWSYLALGRDVVLGSMGNDREGKCVFLLSKSGNPLWYHAVDGVVSNNAIAMADNRVYLLEQTSPDQITSARKRGETLLAKWKIVALDVATGDTVWQTETGVPGRTELWFSDGVLLATGGGQMSGYDAANGDLLYNRAVSMNRLPVIVGDTIYGEPAAYELQTGKTKLHTDPLSGSQTAWTFSRSYGCGSISAAPNLLMFRSSTLGMQDLASDTGIHNFGGVRAGCYVNAIAAGGLVLMPTSDAGCTCSYCFQATIALVPATKQENWSIYYDSLPSASIKHAALNLGAPGDQGDGEGTLWLATPRPATTNRRRDIAIPFRFTPPGEDSSYRHNADVVPIAGTDRPWIYTSGIRGAIRAELDLEIMDRGFAAWPTAPTIDVNGKLEEPAWNHYKSVPAGEGGTVTLRHDQQNLYLAFEKPAVVDATGKVVAWKTSTQQVDGPVWDDDSFAVYFSNVPAGRDAASDKYLHLGVSASNVRYDATWKYVTPALPECAAPALDITVDGQGDDWKENGLRVTSLPGLGGKLRPAEDLDPALQIGWNRDGILLLVQVKDANIEPAAESTPLEQGDSVEVFVTPTPGSADSYRLVVAPDATSGSKKYRSRLDDYRKATSGQALDAKIGATRTTNGYVIEICLPWKNLQMAPENGSTFGLQLLVNDSDKKGQKSSFQAHWHPAGNPTVDPLAYQVFRLADVPSAPLVFQRSEKRDSAGLHSATPPLPFPVVLPPLGAEGEDTQFSGIWTSAVMADPSAFVAELAIPWKTLADAGFDQNQLMVYFNYRRPLSSPPELGKGFERLMLVPPAMTRPRSVAVRLHFAELEDALPGQRVFDVQLQGQTVLEDFDIVAATGGKNRALVKQFDDIVTSDAVRVELIPKTDRVTELTAPVLSGIEILVRE